MSESLASQVQIKFQIWSVDMPPPSLIVMLQSVEGFNLEMRDLFGGMGRACGRLCLSIKANRHQIVVPLLLSSQASLSLLLCILTRTLEVLSIEPSPLSCSCASLVILTDLSSESIVSFFGSPEGLPLLSWSLYNKGLGISP